MVVPDYLRDWHYLEYNRRSHSFARGLYYYSHWYCPQRGNILTQPAMTTRHRWKVPIWFLTLTCAYGAILTAVTLLNWVGADRWWFGALNLYLPQIVWAAPGFLLTVLSLKMARRWVWAPLLCVAWVLGPIMGFCWGTQAPPGSVGDSAVRIMSWNVKYGGYNKVTQLAITCDIEQIRPDVVLLQDAGGLLNGPIGYFFREWNVRSFGPVRHSEQTSLRRSGGSIDTFPRREPHLPAVPAARRCKDCHPIRCAFSVAKAGDSMPSEKYGDSPGICRAPFSSLRTTSRLASHRHLCYGN